MKSKCHDIQAVNDVQCTANHGLVLRIQNRQRQQEHGINYEQH